MVGGENVRRSRRQAVVSRVTGIGIAGGRRDRRLTLRLPASRSSCVHVEHS